ncbi:hypothetical protein [Flavicella sediminum]|uniref:hypothetical protein n=1 Tax=Flavicella sediminum TaxID=2585141 RepID=UPI00112048F5|nr:hypothetical protein [Flavicella sediminum]
MATSNEYTYWHLTPTGWVSGDSKTDFNKKSNKLKPTNTVLTILYKEFLGHPFAKLEITQERIFEIEDKELIKDLEAKYQFPEHIS